MILYSAVVPVLIQWYLWPPPCFTYDLKEKKKKNHLIVLCGETSREMLFFFSFKWFQRAQNHTSFKEVVVMDFGTAFRILEIEWRRKVSVRHIYHCAWSHAPTFTILVNVALFKEDIQGMQNWWKGAKIVHLIIYNINHSMQHR